MQTPDEDFSLLTPIGISYYVAAKHLTVEDYQTLLDRGWRRSGTLLYKPDLLGSCCAQYTLRLDSTKFQPSKDQRQCVNRLNKHILGESYLKEAARRFPLSRDQARKRDTEFNFIERVHESEKKHLKTSSDPAQDPKPAHELEVTLEPDDFTDEKYIIFENYQRLVHREPPHKISKKGFARFLCSSPLPRSADGEPRYGSFHQCYRIDGKLVAVGVLDLLPHCVSGVYFMYHESVHQHSFGKLGALQEIALAHEGGYKYWYSGFYIHSCKKMRYKGDFNPQFLLDPESYEWHPFDASLRKKLDAQKYVSPSREKAGIPYPATAYYKEPSPDPTPADTHAESETQSTTPPAAAEDEDDDDDNDDNDDAASEQSSTSSDVNLPLIQRDFPGILKKDQLLAQVDIGAIRVRIGPINLVTSQLKGFEERDVDNPREIATLFADLAAALGPVVIRNVVIVIA